MDKSGMKVDGLSLRNDGESEDFLRLMIGWGAPSGLDFLRDGPPGKKIPGRRVKHPASGKRLQKKGPGGARAWSGAKAPGRA